MPANDLLIFGLHDTHPLAAKIAEGIGLELAPHEEQDFEDGESKVRPLVDVHGRDVVVVQSLFTDDRHGVNDKLCRLLFFISALKDAWAASVTAVVPYLCYARQDRRSKPQDPVTSRVVAQLFEAAGVDRVIAMDVHDLAAFENGFRCPTIHVEASPLFLEHVVATFPDWPMVVISPDIGGTRRALRFAEALAAARGREIGTAFVEKHRDGGGIIGGAFAGDIDGRTAIIIDDMIGTGGTLLRAARACREHGAARVLAAATHGVFSARANGVIGDEVFEHVAIADTGPTFRLDPDIARQKVAVLDAAPLFATALAHALHRDFGGIRRSIAEPIP